MIFNKFYDFLYIKDFPGDHFDFLIEKSRRGWLVTGLIICMPLLAICFFSIMFPISIIIFEILLCMTFTQLVLFILKREFIDKSPNRIDPWVIFSKAPLRGLIMMLAWIEDAALSPFFSLYYAIKQYTADPGQEIDNVIHRRAAYGSFSGTVLATGVAVVLLLFNPFTVIPTVITIISTIAVIAVVAKCGEILGRYSGAIKAKHLVDPISRIKKINKDAAIPANGNDNLLNSQEIIEENLREGHAASLADNKEEKDLVGISKKDEGTNRFKHSTKSSREILSIVLQNATLPHPIWPQQQAEQNIIFNQNLELEQKTNLKNKLSLNITMHNFFNGYTSDRVGGNIDKNLIDIMQDYGDPSASLGS